MYNADMDKFEQKLSSLNEQVEGLKKVGLAFRGVLGSAREGCREPSPFVWHENATQREEGVGNGEPRYAAWGDGGLRSRVFPGPAKPLPIQVTVAVGLLVVRVVVWHCFTWTRPSALV